MNNDFDSIVKSLPDEYVITMSLEAIQSIYDFNKYEVGLNVVTREDMLGWRKYYSVEECCEKLGLTDCDTWEDVTEFYPVYEMMSDGAMLVAVE